jgi:hypothetical protein
MGVRSAILRALGVEDLAEQPLEALLPLDRLVEHELERGDAAKPEPLSDLMAQERGRAVQGLARVPRAASSPSAV